jgi:hypothetical protein
MLFIRTRIFAGADNLPLSFAIRQPITLNLAYRRETAIPNLVRIFLVVEELIGPADCKYGRIIPLRLVASESVRPDVNWQPVSCPSRSKLTPAASCNQCFYCSSCARQITFDLVYRFGTCDCNAEHVRQSAGLNTYYFPFACKFD